MSRRLERPNYSEIIKRSRMERVLWSALHRLNRESGGVCGKEAAAARRMGARHIVTLQLSGR